jgi:predicted nucleic acid-binding protein
MPVCCVTLALELRLRARDRILCQGGDVRAQLTPDSDDDYLIALAQAAAADGIVSGDNHLLQFVNPSPPVLMPRRFAERLG